jgi:hypothetical protein
MSTLFVENLFSGLMKYRRNVHEQKRIQGAAMNDLTGKNAESFAIYDSNGCLHTQKEYAGSWLLLVFHRHLG